MIVICCSKIFTFDSGTSVDDVSSILGDCVAPGVILCSGRRTIKFGWSGNDFIQKLGGKYTALYSLCPFDYTPVAGSGMLDP